MSGVPDWMREWFPGADGETLGLAWSLWERTYVVAPDLGEVSRYALMVNLAEEARMCGDAQAGALWLEIQRRRGRSLASRG